jgi:hypothetical protein
MDTFADTTVLGAVLAALFALVLVGIAAWAYSRRKRSDTLRERFGPEYERAVNEYGDQQVAEQKLRERQERVEGLQLRTLEPEERLRFARAWREVQARFVDGPSEAVDEANRLIKEVMGQRGYPVGDFDQRAADVSVGHADVVQHYRAARDIARRNERKQATTEDLRQAMVHYRALFEELLHERGVERAEEVDRTDARALDREGRKAA